MSAVDQEASHEETNGRGAELSSENTLQLILSHLHLLKEDDLQQVSFDVLLCLSGEHILPVRMDTLAAQCRIGVGE